MGKIYVKEDAIALKKKGFKKLNSLLESLLAKTTLDGSEDSASIKKATLISKWIEQYANYLSFEPKFDPTRYINYKRGDIVFVNFGFGLGNEFGGNHYAVVLDKQSKHNSPSITVIPLSSFKEGKPIHERDIFLGNELYEKMYLKLQTRIPELREQLNSIKTISDLIREKSPIAFEHSKFTELDQLQNNLKETESNLEKDITDAERIKQELNNLKKGSVAKVEQIRTISKMRIYNPRGKRDPLYNIHFSEPTMQKINDKLKELFVFDE